MATSSPGTTNDSDTTCPLCHKISFQPKLLHCNHHMCQMCIDNSLTFHGDGSATMSCPKCAVETRFGAEETSNDLMVHDGTRTESSLLTTLTSAQSSTIETTTAELTSTETTKTPISVPLCTYKDGCTSPISVICCGYKMCTICSQNHTNKSPTGSKHQKVSLCFDPRDKQLRGLCEIHRGVCYTHLCGCGDNVLLCVYCVHRDPVHKHHPKRTIEGESRAIREALVENHRLEMIALFSSLFC